MDQSSDRVDDLVAELKLLLSNEEEPDFVFWLRQELEWDTNRYNRLMRVLEEIVVEASGDSLLPLWFFKFISWVPDFVTAAVRDSRVLVDGSVSVDSGPIEAQAERLMEVRRNLLS